MDREEPRTADELVAKAVLGVARLHELNGNKATAEELYREAITAAAAACAPRPAARETRAHQPPGRRRS